MIIEERERKIILYSSLCFQSPEFKPMTWYLLLGTLCFTMANTYCLIGTSMSDQQRNKRNSKKKREEEEETRVLFK
jgi:hypothetical protein